MKRVVCGVLSILSSLLIIIAALFSSLQLVMNNESFYYGEYEKIGLEAQIGISNTESARAIMRLVDYMEGRVDSIQLTVTENGETVEMYNQREILHMQDVRVLYQAWRGVRNYGLLAAAAGIAALFALQGRRKGTLCLCRGFLWASALFAALIAVLGVWVATDFNSFWTQFHYLFFDNDLWLLDYSTCHMIRICPETLFYDIVVRFGGLFLAVWAALTAAAAMVKRRVKARGEAA